MRTRPSAAFLRFVLGTGLTLGLAMAGYHVLIGYSETWDYNAVRLQRTFVLAAGEPLYAGRDSGAVLDMIYGPISAVAYLPATLWRTPAPAVLAGQVLSLLFVLTPVLGWLWRRRRGEIWPTAFGGLTFAFLVIDSRPLEYAAFTVHADAPALGLGMLALAVLGTGREESPKHLRLAASASLAVLAVWTKLMMLPLLLALPAVLAWTSGRRTAFAWLGWLGLTGSALSALLIWIFGPLEPLLFNLWTVPARHTLGELTAGAALSALGRLAFEAAPVLGLWVLALVLRWTGERGEWRRDPAVSLGFVALTMLPLAILGLRKAGGDINAFAYVIYFLASGAVLSLAASARDRVARRVLLAAPSLLALLVLFVQEPGSLRTWREEVEFASFPHQRAYDYLRAHPGRLYFPRITLAHLLAEGVVYHQSNGIADREISGFPMTSEHLRAHIPSGLQGVAFADNGFRSIVTYLRLPEFSEPGDDPELPGFVIYRPKQALE